MSNVGGGQNRAFGIQRLWIGRRFFEKNKKTIQQFRLSLRYRYRKQICCHKTAFTDKQKLSCDDRCKEPVDGIVRCIKMMKAVEERIVEYEICK